MSKNAKLGIDLAKPGTDRTVHAMRDGSQAKASLGNDWTALAQQAFRDSMKQTSAADIDVVIGQLGVLRETLPAITDSNLCPLVTQRSVERASEMLAEYRARLAAEEGARKAMDGLSTAGAEAVRVDNARAEGFKAGVESVKAKAKKARR